MTKEAIDQALEALEETRNALAWFYDSYPQDVTKKGNDLLPHVETVLTALREALAEQPAQLQQEPVAWYKDEDGIRIYYESKVWDDATPLYTSSPAQRKPLTLEYIDQRIGADEGDREAVVALVREVEAAHDIKDKQ